MLLGERKYAGRSTNSRCYVLFMTLFYSIIIDYFFEVLSRDTVQYVEKIEKSSAVSISRGIVKTQRNVFLLCRIFEKDKI